MLELFSGGELSLPGLPTTVALAAVATIGYLIGRLAKPEAPGEQLRLDLQRALGETRQLEQIADDVLEATRSALAECRRFAVAVRTDSGQPSDRSAPNVFSTPSETPRSPA
ncbi:MAG TPA: hypothetical protein VMV10_05135 [Pirellulales bacterium]|nr:hypothetical protein [Pirellulales bacterium]